MAAAPSSGVTTLRAALLDAEAEAARAKAINADLAARVALLELQNEKMRRALYGQPSDRRQLLIDQLELGLEELEPSAGEDEAQGQRAAAGTTVEAGVHPSTTFAQAATCASAARAGRRSCADQFRLLRFGPAVEARRGRDRDARDDPAPVEGDPDRARAVRVPRVRGGDPAAGTVPRDAARDVRAELPRDGHVREVRNASAAQPAAGSLCP